MTFKHVMKKLNEYGNDHTKNICIRYEERAPISGVKLGDLKKIIKKDHSLALEHYETGNSDAMYLAGLIADSNSITKEALRRWIN